MNRSLIAVVTCLLCSYASMAEEDSDVMNTCGGFDATGLTEGRPVIRVEPVVGAERRDDAIESCVVVAYGLKEKRGSDGAALLAYKPKAVAQGDDVTRKEKKAAGRAVSKWLFLAKAHEASEDPIYYSVIVF